MSRSKRKTPIIGITTSKSDAWYKKFFHKTTRVRLKKLLSKGDFDSAEIDPPYDDWATPKDGKQYLTTETRKKMPELMRK